MIKGCFDFAELALLASLDRAVMRSHIDNGIPDLLGNIIIDNNYLLSFSAVADRHELSMGLIDECAECANLIRVYVK